MNIQETQKLGDKEKLRLERHRIALEKLQPSWMKKTLTLSALGFTSYRFFYSRMEADKAPLFELLRRTKFGHIPGKPWHHGAAAGHDSACSKLYRFENSGSAIGLLGCADSVGYPAAAVPGRTGCNHPKTVRMPVSRHCVRQGCARAMKSGLTGIARQS